jgi:pseudouridine-5'-phosphate glycosidase
LGLPGGLLVTVPIPQNAEIPAHAIEPIIATAVAEAEAQGLRSAQVTPVLLNRISQLSGTASLQANLALLKNNAKVAAQIAVSIKKKPVILR